MSKVRFVCFHRISNEISPAYQPIPVKVFDKIINYLARNYFVVPLNDVDCLNTTRKKKLVITFDDAYYDFYENALPVLVKYQLSAVQHVITHCANTGEVFWTQELNKIVEGYFKMRKEINIEELGYTTKINHVKKIELTALQLYRILLERNDRNNYIDFLKEKLECEVIKTPMMGWCEIEECVNNNILIGSHTHSHQNLALLTKEELLYEIGHSATIIRERVGHCFSLAFPNGQYSKDVIDVTRQFHIPFLFTTEKELLIENTYNDVCARYSLYHNVWWKNWLRLLSYKYQNSK